MKKIEAIIRPEKVEAVCSSLEKAGCADMTISGFAIRTVNEAGADGLFYGNPSQFWIQAFSSMVVIFYVFSGTYILATLLKKTVGLRVGSMEEEVGLGISEHGEQAYA